MTEDYRRHWAEGRIIPFRLNLGGVVVDQDEVLGKHVGIAGLRAMVLSVIQPDGLGLRTLGSCHADELIEWLPCASSKRYSGPQ